MALSDLLDMHCSLSAVSTVSYIGCFAPLKVISRSSVVNQSDNFDTEVLLITCDLLDVGMCV